MRIVIDMQGAQTESRFRGIGSYSLNFTKAVIENRGDHDVHLVLNGLLADSIIPILKFFEGFISPQHIHIWTAPSTLTLDLKNKDLAALANLEIRRAFIENLQPDIVHLTSLFEGYQNEAVTEVQLNTSRVLSSVTLYDLIPYAHPNEYLDANTDYAKFYLEKINQLKRANICLAISEFSLNEFVHYFPESTIQSVNISAAISPKLIYRKEVSFEKIDIEKKFGIQKKFLLYAGGDDRRKNLPRLIEAFSKLHLLISEPLQLVFVGQMTEQSVNQLRAVAKKYQLTSDELIFTGYVPSKVLSALYTQCTCFVFPSWHEGFGLPVLEAMTNGVAVIASNISSLPEVIGLDEALFDPFSVNAIAEKMAEVIQNEALREKLMRHGLERSKLFSWKKTALKAWAAWENAWQTENHAIAKDSLVKHKNPKQLKLAFVSPLPPSRTGVAEYSALLLQHLRQYYEIELIVEDGVSNEFSITHHFPSRNISWFLENHSSYDRVLYQMGNSPFHWSALEIMKQVQGVTVLHDFYLSGLMSWLDAQVDSESGWPRALYESHGYVAIRDWAHSHDQAKLLYPVNWDVFSSSKAVIAHSALTQNMSREWYGDLIAQKVKVIPLLREASTSQSREIARRKLNFSDDDFVVCSFGFLDSTKQNLELLEAWSQCQERNFNLCQLIFVGQNEGGDYGDALYTKIRKFSFRDRVRITGFVKQEDYVDYLIAADIAVQLRTSSRGETSAAALDCLAYGLPLIVNSNGTMKELPDEAVLKLPDIFTVQELVSSIEKLMKDAALRREMKEAGIAFIKSNHSPSICSEKYHKFIENAYLTETTNPSQLADKIGSLLQQMTDVDYLNWAQSLSLNFPQNPPGARLFLDVTATSKTNRSTGIERVARNLCKEFLISPFQGYRTEPVGIHYLGGRWHARYETQFTLELLGIDGLKLEQDVVEPQPGDIYLVTDLAGPEFLAASQSGLFFEFRKRGVRIYSLIYDLLPIKLPHVFPSGASIQHEKWLQEVLKLDGAICISKSVKKDLIDWCQDQRFLADDFANFSIESFQLGFDFLEDKQPVLDFRLQSTLIQKIQSCKAFLSVGTLEPRKNYLQSLDAFSLLWSKNLEVIWVIVGREGWTDLPKSERKSISELIEKITNHSEFGKRLFWFNDAEDACLAKLYSCCNCLFTNSLGEGLGLPLIEAGKYNLHQLVRDLPVFREVAGDVATFFQAETADELAKIVEKWLFTEFNEKPVTSNIRLVKWKDSAEQLASIFFRNALKPIDLRSS